MRSGPSIQLVFCLEGNNTRAAIYYTPLFGVYSYINYVDGEQELQEDAGMSSVVITEQNLTDRVYSIVDTVPTMTG